MRKDDFYKLIVSDLTSNISTDEQKQLEEAIREDTHLNSLYSSLKNYWNKFHPKSTPHNIVGRTEEKLKLTESKGLKSKTGFILKIAATILIVISLGYSTYTVIKPKYKIVLNEYSCTTGEIKKIVLTDGTNVWLNSKSLLIASEPFIGDTREVKLFGEAYFEVAHNEEQPFIVKTMALKTEVLGTHFNIVAYPTDELHEISLYEGGIQLNVEGSTNQPVILTPGERAYFSAESGKIRVIDTDLGQPAKWRDGILRFYDEDLFCITKKLERKFHTRIFIADSVVGKLKFSAEFEVESLETILKLLKKAHKFNYKKTENGIIINAE